ncbi:hypothetical protein JCM6882_001246 [Rhodosporidiobolus microsporus]
MAAIESSGVAPFATPDPPPSSASADAVANEPPQPSFRPLQPISRDPPPPTLQWAPPHSAVQIEHLPPLPPILSPSLAQQARTTKDFIGVDCRTTNFKYDDEIGSYRRLEWLGDSKLHDAYARRLFRLIPEVGSGILTKIRSDLSSNDTHSYIAWAYGLDHTILEPPAPKKPKKNWRPLSQTQNIVADLFEAHLGALVVENRGDEVERWADAFFERIADDLRSQARGLLEVSKARDAESRKDFKKRNREENRFEDGWEMDPLTQRRRTSYLGHCPSSASTLSASAPIRWDDRVDPDGSWHCHLVTGDATIGCGRGRKQKQARDASVVDCFTILPSKPDLQAVVCERPASSSSSFPSSSPATKS